MSAHSCPRVLTTAAHEASWLAHLGEQITSCAKLVQANQFAIRRDSWLFSEDE
jgi:hypothetical protein